SPGVPLTNVAASWTCLPRRFLPVCGRCPQHPCRSPRRKTHLPARQPCQADTKGVPSRHGMRVSKSITDTVGVSVRAVFGVELTRQACSFLYLPGGVGFALALYALEGSAVARAAPVASHRTSPHNRPVTKGNTTAWLQ